MLETFLSALSVFFVPTIVDKIPMPQALGFIGSFIASKFLIVVFAVIITILFNIMRHHRDPQCIKRDSKGVSTGFKKGLLSGIFGISAMTLVKFIPPLEEFFEILSFIPVIGDMVDGWIMALYYTVGYLFIAWPVWGPC